MALSFFSSSRAFGGLEPIYISMLDEADQMLPPLSFFQGTNNFQQVVLAGAGAKGDVPSYDDRVATNNATGEFLINEFQPNPDGSDPSTVTIELKGAAGASFSGWIVSVESDPGGSNPGDINNFEAVSGTFDSNGLLTVTIDDLENPSFTVVLTDSFTGDANTDIDTDDDGVVDDASTFGTIYDAIGIADTSGDEATLYGTDLGGRTLPIQVLSQSLFSVTVLPINFMP